MQTQQLLDEIQSYKQIYQNNSLDLTYLYEESICRLMQMQQQIQTHEDHLWTTKKIIQLVFNHYQKSQKTIIFDICMTSIIYYYDKKNSQLDNQLILKIKQNQNHLSDYQQASVNKKVKLLFQKFDESVDEVVLQESPYKLCLLQKQDLLSKKKKILLNIFKFLYSSYDTFGLSTISLLYGASQWINSKFIEKIFNIQQIDIEYEYSKDEEQIDKVKKLLNTLSF